MTNQSDRGGGEATEAAVQDPAEGFRLSPLQEHLWRLGEPARRPLTARVRIHGPLVADALHAALQGLAAEHEVLRTGFSQLAGTHVAVQIIGDAPRVAFAEHDLADAPDALATLEGELAAERFDLERGPVLRAALVRLGPDESVLLLAQPPLAADAVSLWNLVRLVCATLRGDAPRAASGEEEDGPIQLADVAQWLLENLESEEARPGLEHWSGLDVSAARFQLPLAAPRTDGAGEESGPLVCARRWTDAEERALEGLAAACGATPGAVLLAAWQLLLARLSGKDDPMVGLSVEGRGFEGLPEALGPFARMLPLEGRSVRHRSFRELVRAAHDVMATAEEWAETFDPQRLPDLGASGLPYAFAYHGPLEEERTGSTRWVLEDRSAVSEPAHMTLVLDRGLATPRLAILHDPCVFGEADARATLEQLGALLAGLLERPDADAGEVSLLSEAARADLLERFAPGPELREEALPLHERVASVAARGPERAAVWAEERELTYGELDARANQLARHLRSLGAGPGSIVGLFLDRSVEQVVGILGVLKAGAAYLPLPPGYPDDRIAFMLEDTGCGVVLTRAAVAERLPDGAAQVVVLDRTPELDALDASPPEEPEEGPGDAYVIFTSGSTGKPKGVPISHANLAHSNAARLQAYRHPVGAYLLLSSFAFDSSVAGIFWTLAQGGRLVLPPDGFEEEIPAIAGMIERHGITHMLGLPTLYGVILETAAPGQLDSLRTVIVAGESCSRELLRLHAERLPGTDLVNEYGPTEGTVWSTCFDCSEPFARTSVPIGRPIPGAEAYVVDPEERDLVPVGVAGELWVAGPGVARGYLGRPALTAERFVEADFGRGTRRCYRTGDLVRFLPDGRLEFLGRIDHQVKIRGYRVELEEIEATLGAHPGVREAVVLAREDSPGDRRLVAYVTARRDAGSPVPDATDLREHLAGPLPDYMVPAHFVLLDDLPLLPNGKVDRGALPAPDKDRSGVSVGYSAPRTPLERLLVGIWSEVLEVERVGAEDDFFELGGHSILATRLFARLVDLLQVTIPLRAIFDTRTPRGLAGVLLADEGQRVRLERTAEIVLEVLETPEDEL